MQHCGSKEEGRFRGLKLNRNQSRVGNKKKSEIRSVIVRLGKIRLIRGISNESRRKEKFL